MKQLPRADTIRAGRVINITLDVPTVLAEEQARLQTALDKEDALELIAHYPLRETGALPRIAQALGFQDRAQYEGAVRKLLSEDEDARVFAPSLFGGLGAAVAAVPASAVR